MPAPPAKPSQSAEDYLERIHELIESKGTAHVADIAQSLNVGQPSVTSMVQKLADNGYLRYEKYRSITLTDEGRTVALHIRDRHIVLANFFTLFGLEGSHNFRFELSFQVLGDFFDIDNSGPRLYLSSQQGKIFS